jgi:hypothetical protein
LSDDQTTKPTQPCPHCAIWDAIRAHSIEHRAPALISAVAEVAAEILAQAPDGLLLEAKLHFALQVANFTAAKRRRREEGAAPQDPDRAGATLQ